jgi:hypothetical protein
MNCGDYTRMNDMSNNFSTKINVNCIYRLSSHRAVNTISVTEITQLVLHGEIISLLSSIQNTSMHFVPRSVLNVLVHKVTTKT